MRTARPLSVAALAVALAGLTAVPAGADGPGGAALSPSTVVPGEPVAAHSEGCGSRGVAAGDASAVGAGSFTLAPSGTEGRAVGRFEVPPSAQPGTYEIVVRCADGTRSAADLSVVLAGAADLPAHPRGHVDTGVGGALGPDPVQTAAGVAALAVAAAGGTWLLHRRARGDGI
ncbi:MULTISPECIES: hypothetical protein [unclassified Streptomyces]|uniref:hypothetical protein n=1 Tax=Streptomyces sp. NPDC005955 TaxID=3364738 RepID=UPI00367A189C